MFTKEHYESVASVLSAAHSKAANTADLTQFSIDHAQAMLDRLAETFADYFEQDNELFARKAFIGACRAASRSEIRRLVAQSNATVKVGKRIEWPTNKA